MSALDPKFEGEFGSITEAATDHAASFIQDGGDAATGIFETIVDFVIGFFGG